MHTPLLKSIGGRRVDAIVLKSGELIPPSTITGIPHHVMHLFHTDKIQQFQIIQHSLTQVDILLVIDEQLRDIGPKVDDMKAEIKKLFEEKIGPGVTISVKEVEKITMIRPGSATPPPVVISKVNMPKEKDACL